MRTESTSASRNADSVQDAERREVRKPADSLAVERFRHLLEQARDGRLQGDQQLADQASANEAQPDTDTKRVKSAEPIGNTDASWMQNVQRVWLDVATAPPAPTQSSMPSATLADLIERHVRQLLVGEVSATGDSNQVLLKLSDATLPDTDLLLTRSAEGWKLRVESTRADSARSVEDGMDALIARFEQRRLGKLEVEIVQPPT